jgi:hypothetical protein
MASEMKLSDAIEAGWKIAPQSWKDGWGTTRYGEWHGTCAVGAAIIGAVPGVGAEDLYLKTACDLFPQLSDLIEEERLPEGITKPDSWGWLDVGDVIQCMNDNQHRPGAEIVAYLRQLGY